MWPSRQQPTGLLVRLTVGLFAALAMSSLHGEGIALSLDGHTWLAGAGEYGRGWGVAGRGITVQQGGVFYVKYHSRDPAHPVLHYALHGTEWGSWSATGPAPGSSAGGAVILKVERAGTPMATARWMNESQAWAAFTAVGSYDLGLREQSVWTLPPITITSGAAPGFWSKLFRHFNSPDTAMASNTPGGPVSATVNDSGSTAVLLAASLVGGALAARMLRKGRARHLDKL